MIRLDLKDADIRDVLIALGKQAGVNIVADPELQGKITMHLESVPFLVALKAIVEPYGYAIVRVGELYRIRKQEALPALKAELLPDGTLILVARQSPLREVLQEIARVTGKNIVLRPEVQGAVTLTLDGIGVTDALNLLAANFNCELREENGIAIIGPPAPASAPTPRAAATLLPNGTLSLHIQQSPLHDVLREIARVTGKSIVLRPEVQGTVTIDLEGVEVEEGLRLLVTNFGYELNREGTVYIVALPPPLPAPVPAPPPAPPAQIVTVADGKLTIDVKGLEIKELLARIARASGLNIIAANDVAGPVDLYVNAIPLESGLETLLHTQGYTVRRADDVYRVFKNPEAQGRPVFNIAFRDGNLTVDVQEADLGNLLTEISQQSGNDLVVFGSIRDKVNVKLTGVPLNAALDLILAGTRWSAQRRGNIILVGDRSPGATTSGLLTRTKVITLKHLKVAEVLNLLPPNFPTSSINLTIGLTHHK